jgi:prepilin-type N-terminal cleavage/methylation domain-containing protein
MKKIAKNKKGFTLVELVIVIAILGILAAVGLTLFPKLSSTTRINSDKTLVDQVKSAAANYVAESTDPAAATTLGVDTDAATVIATLQAPIEYNGKNYGPYLDPNEQYDLQTEDAEWVITYDAADPTTILVSTNNDEINGTTP